MANAPNPSASPASQVAAAHPAEAETAPEGPRKLIRPRLPANSPALPQTPRRLRGPAPLAGHQTPSTHDRAAASSHAETLYFQKQIQSQTPMIFVLEGGEQIQGTIEWHDRDSIKVRGTTRTLIYKHSLKYLHKAAEI